MYRRARSSSGQGCGALDPVARVQAKPPMNPGRATTSFNNMGLERRGLFSSTPLRIFVFVPQSAFCLCVLLVYSLFVTLLAPSATSPRRCSIGILKRIAVLSPALALAKANMPSQHGYKSLYFCLRDDNFLHDSISTDFAR